MLLPSAFSLSCDSTTTTQSRYHSSNMFSSAPLSPSPSPSSTFPTLYSTCRALQSMLTSPNQLPSPPPTSHASLPAHQIHSSPFKLRLRTRRDDVPRATTPPTTTHPLADGPRTPPRRRIVKRAQAVASPPQPQSPPRGINKRRRSEDGEYNMLAVDELRGEIPAPRGQKSSIHGDEGRIHEPSSTQDENEYNHNWANDDSEPHSQSHYHSLPSTPKRLRRGPETLPFGLARSDFRSLQLPRPRHASRSSADLDDDDDDDEEELDFDVWTTDDDRVLVELVLEKLKLSKSEWQDCARSLGRDRRVVGRRWRSLMERGEVGLKSGIGSGSGSGSIRNRGRVGRRTGIHGSWR